MIDFWVNILEKLRNHNDVVLLYVLESEGSSPGRAGFRMMVASDGDMHGSIGGGIMEHKLVEQARQLINSGDFTPFTKQQIHQSDIRTDKSGMICSGQQTIAFYLLTAKDQGIFEDAIKALSDNQTIALVLSSDGLQFKYDASNFIPGLTWPAIGRWRYQEILGFKNSIYIIGGGYVGLALSEVMNRLGFYVTVIDDRTNLNTVKMNHFAHNKAILDYSTLSNHVTDSQHTYVAIMTFGYRSDEICIKQLIHKKLAYLGVMGSRKKMNELLTSLLDQGYAQDALNKLQTPIGLPIHSKTPMEIAVSVAAEIISIKNKAL